MNGMVYPQAKPAGADMVIARDGLWFAPLETGLVGSANFTRASTGSVRSGVGILGSAAVDIPRFEVTPVAGLARGVLLEGSATNFARSTGNLTDAWWSKLGATVATSAVVSSDGTSTMHKLVEGAVAGEHSFYRSLTVTAGRYFAVSVEVKAAERGTFGILLSSSSNAHMALGQYNLGTAVASSQVTGSGTVRESSMHRVSATTYRCCLIGRAGPADTSIRVAFCVLDATLAKDYTGDGSSGVHVAMPQIETGSGLDICTSYIPNTSTTSDVTRSADVLRWTDMRMLGLDNDKGTFVMDFRIFSQGATDSGTARRIIELGMNSGNRMDVSYMPGETRKLLLSYRRNTGLATTTVAGSETITPMTRYRLAFSYGKGTVAASVNGAAAQTGVGSTGIVWSELRLGSSAYTNTPLGGWVSRLAYYATDKMDVQALSAV